MSSKTIAFAALIILHTFTGAAQTKLPPADSISEKVIQSDSDYKASEIDRLKDAVVDEKLQMRLLRHLTKKEGLTSGSTKISLHFITEMSSRYKLYSVNYKIDGQNVYSYFYGDVASTESDERMPKEITQPVTPGTHSIEVQIVHTGNDTGVFAYLNDYKILTEKKFSFEVAKETQAKIELIAYEKGWLLTDFKERPDLHVKINGSLLP